MTILLPICDYNMKKTRSCFTKRIHPCTFTRSLCLMINNVTTIDKYITRFTRSPIRVRKKNNAYPCDEKIVLVFSTIHYKTNYN